MKLRNQIKRDDADENYFLVFPTLNVELHFTWIEGVLAGSSLPLVRAIESIEDHTNGISMPTVSQHWTQIEADLPTKVLKQMKIVKEMSNRQIKSLDAVHQAIRNMNHPSKADLRRRIQELVNADFTEDDIKLYFEVFNVELGALKGKSESENVHNKSNRDSLKPDEVLLSGDLVDFAGVVFLIIVLVTPGEYRTSMIFGDMLPDLKTDTITCSIIKTGQFIKTKYKVNIGILEFDRQAQINNYAAKSEIEDALGCTIVHVSTHACYAENAAKHTKCRVRSRLSSLIYDVNRTILSYVVVGAINALNCTTRSGNGGKSARYVLSNEPLDYKSYFAMSPNDLVEVHVQSDNNVLHYRTITAVPLIPVVNNHTDWTFYSLETGQLFVRDYRHAHKVPWSYEARLRMRYLATLDPIQQIDSARLRATELSRLRHEMKKQFRIQRGRTRRRQNQQADAPIELIDHNQEEVTEEDVVEEDTVNDDVVGEEAAEAHSTEHDDIAGEQNHADITSVIAATIMDPDEQYIDSFLDDYLLFPGAEELFDLESLQHADEVGVYTAYTSILHKALNSDYLEKMQADGSQVRSKEKAHRVHNTFQDTIVVTTFSDGKREASNHGLGVDVETCAYVDYLDTRQGYLFSTQVTAKKALETFGEAGIQAIKAEIDGLLQKKVFTGILKDNLTETQRKRIIRMSCFVKEKRDSKGNFIKLKARLVAGGHMQDRSLYNPEDTSSPTVSTSSIFSIISTGVSEARSFMSFDISMAYLNADMKDEVFMTLDPEMTRILVEQDSSGTFARNISTDGRVTVKLNKALYGCIQSAKLWYDHLSKFLMTIGFSPNPVDPCVFNRLSHSGKQTTLAIHVDDGLATSEDVEDLNLLKTQLMKKFEEMECNIAEQKLEYLGMQIDISDADKAVLTMEKYITDILTENEVTTVAETPAANNLFAIEESPRLSEEENKKFHRIVAQLLYLATRTRPDIMLPITFLCSRVCQATQQDNTKLKRVLSYLNSTKDLGIVLGSKGEEVSLSVYADASYAVHADYKSHGGIVISHNRGPALVKCSKQKIVTKSSTEAELVTLSDAVSLAAYNIEFLKGQGYNVSATLYQDNTSTICLAKNGRSNSDRTKHIGIRYYFVKQYLEDGTMKVEHCPTLEMVADILTKPLQGELFRKLRDLLLGYSRRE